MCSNKSLIEDRYLFKKLSVLGGGGVLSFSFLVAGSLYPVLRNITFSIKSGPVENYLI